MDTPKSPHRPTDRLSMAAAVSAVFPNPPLVPVISSNKPRSLGEVEDYAAVWWYKPGWQARRLLIVSCVRQDWETATPAVSACNAETRRSTSIRAAALRAHGEFVGYVRVASRWDDQPYDPDAWYGPSDGRKPRMIREALTADNAAKLAAKANRRDVAEPY